LPTKCLIKAGEYRDSVTLMETARLLTQLPGVLDAAAMMATEANKAILREAGLLLQALEPAKPNDLVIVIQAETDEFADAALKRAEQHLAQGADRVGARMRLSLQPRTIRGAVRDNPGANMAIISVAGQYAAAEAWEALRHGLHVLLFSDNVSIEDEMALKRYATQQGLLMMGPDCGTAIVSGTALGFANAVPRGPVGIVAAAGTGLQEVSTLLARTGVGISQGIGTGGRDLREQVGGTMMLAGIKLLQSDPRTQVLLLISKPPAPAVVESVLHQVQKSTKPTVICFLGGDPGPVKAVGAIPAATLQEAAYLAAGETNGYKGQAASEIIAREIRHLEAQAADLRTYLAPSQRYLRGLFSGGTLASEALVVWAEMRRQVLSNIAVNAQWMLKDSARSEGHCAVDLGDDEFTVGRPHPMLDNDLRIRRLQQEAADPEVAVVVLDVVLGYGVHPDPANELGPAVQEARATAAGEGRQLIVVTSVTGTEEDPQMLSRQVRMLEQAGAIVCSCNAAAARLAGFIVT
jgi:FdrA protein